MTCAAERVDTSSTTINAMSTLPDTLSAAINDNMQVTEETELYNIIANTKTDECLVASNYYFNREKEAGNNDDSSSSDGDETNNEDLDELADFYSSKSNVRKVLFTNLPCNMPQSHLENNNRSQNKEVLPKELFTLQEQEEKGEEQSVKKHTLQDNLRVHEMTMHKRRELHERKLQ